ncbi:hypothetical protein [Spirosoma utsteinense]|uniref:Uncharacterized protein n=1 Tax=Spirosoma utsteinense TaxID=2585773 RepID=A0ABR6W4K7_9BACT|nr:hypothetical protein [Spirosoma utsteinense]MBC3785472.1 hypothetical protein [Spirosoma utsteinense]MBC3791499.1 hypothetical protein [Spirosoma utsteinense]
MKNIRVLLVVIALLTLAPDLMAQCAMCRGTVESTVSDGRSVIASELNFGILYLLVIPYLIVATIGYLWYRNSKQEHGRRLEIAGRVKRALS